MKRELQRASGKETHCFTCVLGGYLTTTKINNFKLRGYFKKKFSGDQHEPYFVKKYPFCKVPFIFEPQCRTPEREVGGSKPTAAVLCP